MLRRKPGEASSPGGQVLPQMIGTACNDVHMDHHSRIAGMKKERDA